ncbi:hypothetical protein X975_05764, partial [Stegodyphus mimosarum]
MSNNKIYVTIPSDMKEELLTQTFQERTGVAPLSYRLGRNYAIIDLPDGLSVEKAIEVLNGYEVMGSQLLVEPSLGQNR